MTERQTILILKTTGPSYFLVRFHVDDTLCVVPRKKLVDRTNQCENGECHVKWSAKEILKATILAMGDKTDVENAEKELMTGLEEQEPPAKRQKTNRKPTPDGKKAARIPLAPIQPVSIGIIMQ